MIDLGTLHAHQIAAALRYQRGPLEPVRYLDGDTTVTLALPRPLYRPARPSRTRLRTQARMKGCHVAPGIIGGLAEAPTAQESPLA